MSNVPNSAFYRRRRRLLVKTYADGGAPVNWSLGGEEKAIELFAKW